MAKTEQDPLKETELRFLHAFGAEMVKGLQQDRRMLDICKTDITKLTYWMRVALDEVVWQASAKPGMQLSLDDGRIAHYADYLAKKLYKIINGEKPDDQK